MLSTAILHVNVTLSVPSLRLRWTAEAVGISIAVTSPLDLIEALKSFMHPVALMEGVLALLLDSAMAMFGAAIPDSHDSSLNSTPNDRVSMSRHAW